MAPKFIQAVNDTRDPHVIVLLSSGVGVEALPCGGVVVDVVVAA